MSTSTTPPVDPSAPVDDSKGAELSIEQRATIGLNQGAIVRQRFLRHRGAVISLFVLAFLVLLAFTSVGIIIGGTGKLIPDFENNTLVIDGLRIAGWWQFDWWSRHDIVLPGGAPTITVWPPSFGDHPFGQDNTGKDVFARVMRGMQQSLIVTFIVGLLYWRQPPIKCATGAATINAGLKTCWSTIQPCAHVISVCWMRI